MRRPRVLVGTVAVVGGAALAATLVALLAGRGTPVSPPPQEIAVATSVQPHVAAFGATITASVDVLLDRRLIDPSSLERRGSLAPWVPAGEAAVTRQDAGPLSRVRFAIRLRCLQAACLPPVRGGMAVQLPDLRLTFRRRDGSTGARSVRWPTFLVESRLGEAEAARLDPGAQPPFRVDLSLPAATYRVRPGLLVALLAAGGGVLLAAAGGLGVRAFAPGAIRLPLPRRRRPAGSPLERALLQVERSHGRGTSERRKALDRLAVELARSGESELSHSALTLAWSAAPPAGVATGELTASVRKRLAREVNGRARIRR